MNTKRAINSRKGLYARVLGIILSLALVLGTLPMFRATEVQAAAEKGQKREKSGKEVYDSLEAMNGMEPKLYKQDKDPYGHGTDVPFTLVSHDRLAVLAMEYNGSKTMKSCDIKASAQTGNTGKVLNNSTENLDYNIPNDIKSLNYVQTVSFDPTGSGSKDHIALIGVRAYSATSAKLLLYVCNKDKQWSNALELGSVNWMVQSMAQFLNQYAGKNFFSVTAGDYNNDHKDTLVVYAAYDGTNQNSYGLNEIVVNANLSMSKKQSAHTRQLTHNIYNQQIGSLLSGTYVGNRLSGAVDSGDVTGDGIDDLVVLTYVNILSYEYGLSIGNVDNADGKAVKEIVVAGVYNSMRGPGNGTVIEPYRIDPGKWYITVFNGKLNMVSEAVHGINTWSEGAMSMNGGS